MALSCPAARTQPHLTPARPTFKGAQAARKPSVGVWANHIEGRYRPIPVHQVAMAWFCYKAGHISFRQFRVVMAAHEMRERRNYAKPEGKADRKPLYGLDELKSLVGGRGSATADAALSGDLRHLARVGLMTMTQHEIRFAAKAEQLGIEDAGEFRVMLEKLPHPRRSVPVPRRVLRALAGGFTAGMAAVTLAVLIRSVFWHKDGGGGGESGAAFRIDGRTKRDWIADVFGVTPRTVTEARARLIELGWLIPLDTPQYLLNRYGAYDAINPGWNSAEAEHDGEEKNGCDTAGSSSPGADSVGESSSPSSNQNTSPTGNQNQKLCPGAGPAGVSRTSTGKKGKGGRSTGAGANAPNIRDIRSEDLADIGRLLQLHDQAIRIGIAGSGEAGRLDFLALAERARMHGRRAGALFFWLLRERKTEFITQAAEDEAARRFKAHRYATTDGRAGSAIAECRGGVQDQIGEEQATHDEQVVRVCQQVGHRCGVDSFRIAAETKGWTLAQWERALAGYEARRQVQMLGCEVVGDGWPGC
jgi:hypothetical protein